MIFVVMIISVIGHGAHCCYHYTNGVNLHLQLSACHRGKRTHASSDRNVAIEV